MMHQGYYRNFIFLNKSPQETSDLLQPGLVAFHSDVLTQPGVFFSFMNLIPCFLHPRLPISHFIPLLGTYHPIASWWKVHGRCFFWELGSPRGLYSTVQLDGWYGKMKVYGFCEPSSDRHVPTYIIWFWRCQYLWLMKSILRTDQFDKRCIRRVNLVSSWWASQSF